MIVSSDSSMRKAILLLLFFFCIQKILFPVDNAIKKDVNPAYASYLKGLLSERYGQPERALKEYIKAKKFDEESTSLNLRVAVQYIKMDNLDEAVTLLTDLKDNEPVSADAYLLLILLYSNQGDEAKANQLYEEMLSRMYKEKPSNLKVAESLAQYKLEKKDYKTALNIYNNILKINPDYIDAHFWIGYLYEEEGNRQKAIQVWKKILERNPEHADTLNSLGYIYAEEGMHLDEAEALIKKALQFRPDSAAYLDSLGWVYFKKKDFLKAQEYIEQAVTILRDPIILDHLGDIYFALEKFQEARKIWEEVLKIQPDNKKVEDKIGTIRNDE